MADESRNHHAELQVRELLADAPVTTGAEWLIRTLCALADETETEVNLGTVCVVILLVCLLGGTLRVRPPCWVPLSGVLPQHWVDLRDGSRREDGVALWNDVLAILGRSSKRLGHNDVFANTTHDTMDRRVNAERLADHRVQNGEVLELVVLGSAPFAIGLAEMLNLFLENSITGKGSGQLPLKQ